MSQIAVTETVADKISREKIDAILSKAYLAEPKWDIKMLMPSKDDIPLAVAGLGAASAAGVASYIQDMLPQEWALKDSTGKVIYNVGNIAELGVGWAIYKFGEQLHPLVSAFGGGMVIKSVGDIGSAFGLYIKPKPTKTPSIKYGSGPLLTEEDWAAQKKDAKEQPAQAIINNPYSGGSWA